MASKPAWADLHPSVRHLQIYRYVNQPETGFRLRCDEREFRVDYEIVSARSEFFRVLMGRNGFSESNEQEATINETEPLVLECLLFYMYTGTFLLDIIDDSWRCRNPIGRDWPQMALNRYLEEQAYEDMPKRPSRTTAPRDKAKILRDLAKLRFTVLLQVHDLAHRFMLQDEDCVYLASLALAILRSAFYILSDPESVGVLTVEDVTTLIKLLYEYTSEASIYIREEVAAFCLGHRSWFDRNQLGAAPQSGPVRERHLLSKHRAAQHVRDIALRDLIGFVKSYPEIRQEWVSVLDKEVSEESESSDGQKQIRGNGPERWLGLQVD